MRRTVFALMAGSMLVTPALAQTVSASGSPAATVLACQVTTSPATVTCPAPIPAPAPTVSAGVAKVGLQAVAALPTATGPRVAATCTPVSCAAQLAALHATASGGLLTITGNGVWSAWDTSGWQIDIENGAQVSFVDSKVMCDCVGPNPWNLAIGLDGSAPNVSFSYTDFNLLNAKTNWGGIYVNGVSVTAWDHDRFHGAANDPFDALNGASTFTWDEFDSFGLNASADAHLEQIHIFSGTHHIAHTLMAQSQKQGAGGASGLLMLSASAQDGGPAQINLTVDSSILQGAATLGAFFTIQTDSRAGPVNVALTNDAIEAGTNGPQDGYVGPTGPVAITGSGNVDYDTGRPITLP